MDLGFGALSLIIPIITAFFLRGRLLACSYVTLEGGKNKNIDPSTPLWTRVWHCMHHAAAYNY